MTDLEKVLSFIDEDEGPELNISPDEPGGSSKHGVSMTVLQDYRKRLGMPKPTMADMEAIDSTRSAQIYDVMFAQPIRFDDLPPGVDYRLLDISISAGLGGCRTILSRVLGSPAEFDDATIAAIKKKDPRALIVSLGEVWLQYKIEQSDGSTKYIKGWTNRKNAVEAR